MAAATFGSPELWAALWMVWSFACFYVALRVARPRRGRARSTQDSGASSLSAS